jgi:peptidoglycan/xylan/chitin deacetylase (PgdA/CDA1 family)
MLTLLYHNILKTAVDGLPVASHQVTVDTFRQHVRRFRNDILNPLEAHEQIRQGKSPRGILITFDDGAAGIEYAAEILAEARKQGVAFICPGAFTSGLWFYRLGDAIIRATVSQLRWRQYEFPVKLAEEKRKAYKALSTELFGWSPTLRDESIAEIETASNLPDKEPHPALKILDETGLKRTAATGGMIFANHSWSHPNLTSIAADELKFEVESAQQWLASSELPTIPWFAFPRGNYDGRVNEVVERICPVFFGANSREPDKRVLPRTYIQEADANPLRLGAKTAFEGRLRRYILWK